MPNSGTCMQVHIIQMKLQEADGTAETVRTSQGPWTALEPQLQSSKNRLRSQIEQLNLQISPCLQIVDLPGFRLPVTFRLPSGYHGLFFWSPAGRRTGSKRPSGKGRVGSSTSKAEKKQRERGREGERQMGDRRARPRSERIEREREREQ